VFGFLLVVAGIGGGFLLFVRSIQQRDQAVKDFARAGVGCTTTLDFTETGTFYVFEETSGSFTVPDGGCEPLATPDQQFGFQLGGPARVEPREDRSLDYDTGDFAGTSVSSFEIETTGRYEIAVFGPDQSSIAAVGRDPSTGVGTMRAGAIAVAAAGVVLGLLLLLLSARRGRAQDDGPSFAASAIQPPAWGGPAGGVIPPAGAGGEWPPKPPSVGQVQVPISPHRPDTPAVPTPPPPPLPARVPAPPPAASPWAPPPPAATPTDDGPPIAAAPPRIPPPPAPRLPDRDGA
jgi:hypothetical protein